jgi:hypothetical protein
MPKLDAGQAFIAGKLVSRIKIKKTWIQVVVAPAIDEYSHPRPFEITSKNPLGEVDELVRVTCNLTGRRAQKSSTDQETGEVKKFAGAWMSLQAVEA